MMKHATNEGTRRYAKKFDHYKEFYLAHNGLLFSKLGLGTFVKEPYKEENYLFSYKKVIKEAILNGINCIDTANNYRYGVSEKEVGSALYELLDEDKIQRDEIILTSKGGFIPLVYPFPPNPYRWIEENILQKNLAKKSDIELDQHCMSPDFIEHSCRQSIENMGVESLDIYFLHNPEMQLLSHGYDAVLKQIGFIFERLEKLVDEGLIQNYGIASWNAFLYEPNHPEHLCLEDLVDIAKSIKGQNHHFKYIQVPMNLAKVQALASQTQMIGTQKMPLLQAAKELDIGVMSSCSLLQMNLFQKPFKAEIGYLLDKQMLLSSDIQLALQFVRSTPGVITSLFSTKEIEHLQHNLEVAKIKAITKDQYNLLFRL